jgi:hypothetical protein
MDKHMKHANNTTNPHNLSSSGILRSTEWYSVTDVSRQLVGPIFKGSNNILYMFSRIIGGRKLPTSANIKNSITVWC